MTEVDAWVAKHRARDRAERDAKDARFDEEQRALDASTCEFCGRRWFTALMARPKAPVWISEAKTYGHLICYQRFLEKTK